MKYILLSLALCLLKSDHCTIKIVSISIPERMDFAPRKFKDGIVFTSETLKENNYTSKTSLYYSEIKAEEIMSEPVAFEIDECIRYQVGVFDYCNLTGEVYLNATNPVKHIDVLRLAIFQGEIEEGKLSCPKKLPFCKPEFSYCHPTISDDGLHLIFTADIEDGIFQLYQSYRNTLDADWSYPQLIEELATYDKCIFPNFINDSLLVYSSDRDEGKGGFDLYTSKKAKLGWGEPENLSELNTEFNEEGLEMMDSKSGYFVSDREDKNSKIYYYKLEK